MRKLVPGPVRTLDQSMVWPDQLERAAALLEENGLNAKTSAKKSANALRANTRRVERFIDTPLPKRSNSISSHTPEYRRIFQKKQVACSLLSIHGAPKQEVSRSP